MGKIFDMFDRMHQLRRSFTVDRGTCISCNHYNVTPSIDLHEKTDELVLYADVPGAQKSDVNVGILGDYLLIEGELKRRKDFNRGELIKNERDCGKFRRKVHLVGYCGITKNLLPSKISATIEDGVLEVRIPKTEHIGKSVKFS